MPRRYLMFFLTAAILFTGSIAQALVPDRPAPPTKKAPQFAKLDQLADEQGARFGDWVLWRHDSGGNAIVMVHQPSGQVVYMPWSSNGWLNFRLPNGVWNVLYTHGAPSPQNRSDLQIAKFLNRRPEVVVQPGAYKFQHWNVTVGADSIEFHNTAPHKDRMTIRPHAVEFTHNGRTVGGN
jgi:hypothetical protein